ncbi:MAG: transposase, partial [Acetobacteraceae bacterium]|nr:transposase [Acetobacteraceae bacterium]
MADSRADHSQAIRDRQFTPSGGHLGNFQSALLGSIQPELTHAGISQWVGFYNGRRPHQALSGRTPMAVWRASV